MAKEWTDLHRCTLRQLEPKIGNARYQLECCERKNTIINVTGQELHIITLALEKYNDWLTEKEKQEAARNPLLDVHTSEPVTQEKWLIF